ncbi:hypothetical protein FHR92_005070 [Fontibacillus solani]|uniref:DUF4269 domain-containing protein n=1 Tax=Fontibacillus solani TaxID=1572857 RepID=A0A7W3SZ15_9BACL|nr:DUF4269 domain-containing protein [Fontibacillus solani]MBA9088553.1 hypothetical protein [Fontibacillus solani]
MIGEWKNIEYLKSGTPTQMEVYQLLKKYKLLEILQDYSPILVGTVPIGIHIQSSDLDIICEVGNYEEFEKVMETHFKHLADFSFIRRVVEGIERVKINFTIEGWPIEIFGQNKPTHEQNGFVHMIIEDRMLKLFGKQFKEQIINLKREGLKTEPAFANLLQLEGDPYLTLLEMSNWTDEELKKVANT